MKCTFCERVVNEKYRVNQIGDCYCNDECYEEHMDANELSVNDNHHPYIDIYENVRSEYIFWATNWQSKLESGNDYLANLDDSTHKIDSFINEHFQYYQYDGDDGVFHIEIHRYLHELRELQVKIINWRPERDEYFTVTLIFDEAAEFQIDDEFAALQSLKEYIKERNMNKNQTNLLIEYIDGGNNSYEWRSSVGNDVWLTYESLEDAEEVAEAFRKFFSNKQVEIVIETSFLCDSGCGIYISTSEAESDLGGWHYEQICAMHDLPGTYSEEELLNMVHKNVEELSVPFRADWLRFTAKVRRSCILHGIDYPHWTSFDE